MNIPKTDTKTEPVLDEHWIYTTYELLPPLRWYAYAAIFLPICTGCIMLLIAGIMFWRFQYG